MIHVHPPPTTIMRALLIVDMQVGCFRGDPPRYEADTIVERINALAEAFRVRELVVYIQHTDAAEGLARDSEEWQLLPALCIGAADARLEKAGCDAFLETGLESLLRGRGVDEVVITGCATDFCVDTTVRSAAAHGFHVTVVSDAHTTRDRPHLNAPTIIRHHNYIWQEFLLPKGRKIRLVTTEECLGELPRGPASDT